MVDRWLLLEKSFEANMYNGTGLAGEVLSLIGNRVPELVVTSVHGVNHTRDGLTKYADRGTGGLVLMLAEVIGCSAVVVCGGDSGDANSDLDHPAKDSVLALPTRPSYLVDFHGMQDRGVDFEIGTALTDLYPAPFVTTIGLAHTFRTVVNDRFDGSRVGTMTKWAQTQGILACQLEISSRLRPPNGTRKAYLEVVSAITDGLCSILYGYPT